MMKILILSIVFIIIFNFAYTQQVERFNYTSGTSITSNGWSIVATPDTSIKIIDSSLNTIGNTACKSIRLNGAAGAVSLSLNSSSGFFDKITNIGSPIYVSFPIKVAVAPSTEKQFFSLMSATGTSRRYYLFIKSVTGGFQLGVSINDEEPSYTSDTFELNKKIQLIFKWTQSNKQTNLYVINDSLPTSEPESSNLTLSSTNTGKNFGKIVFDQLSGVNMLVGGIIINCAWPTTPKAFVTMGDDGKLTYKTDSRKNKVIDFSHAGYMGGGVSLPTAPVKVTLYPDTGDQTSNIQAAIDQVSAIPYVNGTRGAVYLSPGTYDISSTININTSGVVLRGAGSGDDSLSTILNWTTTSSDSSFFFKIAGTGTSIGFKLSDTVDITDEYIPSSATTFNVSDASSFKVGDSVAITRTVTDDWIKFMGMDSLIRNGALETWLAPGTIIYADRVITSISGNTITIDVPLTDSYDSAYLGSPVARLAKYTYTGRIYQVGLEHFRLIAPATTTESYRVLQMSHVKDSWVRDIYSRETNNAYDITNTCKRITLDHLFINFSIANTVDAVPVGYALTGTQVLLSNSGIYGSHTWSAVTNSRGTGPIVVYNFNSTETHGIAPHQRWTTGLLSDNCNLPYTTSSNEGVAYKNRTILGTGHGWTTGFSVAWNVTAPYLLVSQPPGTMNWSFGGTGTKYTDAGIDNGIYDNLGTIITNPKSLYIQQLKERLGISAVTNMKDTTLPNDITDNGGTLSAQYTGSSDKGEGSASLIDNDYSTKYYVSGQTNIWVIYKSNNALAVNRYAITSANDVPTRDPKDWTLYGSNTNNDSDWVQLDQRTNITFDSRNLTKYFDLKNDTNYTYYKLVITNNNGATATQFAELELFGTNGIDISNETSNSISQNGALQYSSSGGYVNAGSVIEFNNTTAFTIEAWIYADTLNTGYYKTILSNWGGTLSSNRVELQVSKNNQIIGLVCNGSSSYGTAAATTLVTGQWYHVAMVYDGSQTTNANKLKIYINGVLQTLTFTGTIPSSTSSTLSSGSTFVGAEKTDLTAAFKGKIDEVRVWNAALSANTITNYMNYMVNTCHPNYDNLKLYWQFNDGASPVTACGPTSYTGTLASNVAYTTSTVDTLIYSCLTATSVKGMYLKTIKNDNNIILSWSTTTEINNKQFNILQSFDNKTWSLLTSVFSKAKNGNSNSILNYTYTIENPSAAKHYYKLKQIDFDNIETESNTSLIIITNNSSLEIYPNPASSILNIKGIDLATVKSISLIDISGRTVYETKDPHSYINVSGLSLGTYILKIKLQDSEIYKKVIIKK